MNKIALTCIALCASLAAMAQDDVYFVPTKIWGPVQIFQTTFLILVMIGGCVDIAGSYETLHPVIFVGRGLESRN